ncbi:hypothetical protein GCWU000324_01844 [Kingella oralis ATCC 51147]|uniref:Uncharacterized protein n=1 Tax=Kingella oralis ATCC 51147 TaxID=629741 RepID=C4GIH3_9NEIS|nr:hypothetical protein GCWU000324_01844 [Kingella oralis ATCC 51147]
MRFFVFRLPKNPYSQASSPFFIPFGTTTALSFCANSLAIGLNLVLHPHQNE